MTTFKKYSKYYDKLYEEKDYKGEVRFVRQVLKNNGFKGNKLLSLGIGTAGHEIILARKNFSITGYDLSSTMLKIANRKIKEEGLQDKIKLIRGDVRNLKIDENFDLATAMFNVLGYQNSNQDVSRMFAGVSSALNKDGFFVFDCWHSPAVYKDKPINREKIVKKGRMKIIRSTKAKFRPTEDIIEIIFNVRKIKGEEVVDSIQEKHNMRFFSIPELRYFLENNGLKLVKVYNFLEPNSQVSDNKWDIFVVAKKL